MKPPSTATTASNPTVTEVPLDGLVGEGGKNGCKADTSSEYIAEAECPAERHLPSGPISETNAGVPAHDMLGSAPPPL